MVRATFIRLFEQLTLLLMVALTMSDVVGHRSWAEEFAAADFVPLFNGKDFTGWRFSDASAAPQQVPAAWRVVNGTIVGQGDPGTILASQWDYADFEFEFEWKAGSEDFDADLYLHASRLLDADPIRMTKNLVGGPQETDRGEGFYNASATGSIGGGGSARKPVPQLQKPIGQWNTWRITAHGPKFTLTCNGQEAWSCTDHVPRSGYIGFKVFQGSLELRNLRLREMGFRSLMNMSEWEVYPGYGGRGPLDEHWQRDGLLWTFKGPGPSIVTKKKDFRNYQLRMEFLFADPNPAEINSGVYLRGVHPWQADIWEHKWGSGLWGVQHVSARMASDGKTQYYPELGKVIRPITRMDNPTGQWNYLEIRVEDGVVSTWLNGRPTVDRYPIKEVDPKFPDAGGVGLQAHAPWKEVRYHDIRIKELKRATPESR
jgi:hypothetical protein